MKEKPLLIKAIGLGYILLVVLFYLQTAFLYEEYFWNFFAVLSYYTSGDYVVSAATVIAGMAILKVRPWSFYIFIIHAIGVMFWNLLLMSDNPSLNFTESFSLTYEHCPDWVVVSYLAAVCLIIGLFFQRKIRSPYFSPKLRWWEHEKRYELSLPVQLIGSDGQSISGKTFDISASGLFLKGKVSWPLGTLVTIKIEGLDLDDILLQGELVWITAGTKTHPEGAGIHYRNISKAIRKKLKKEIQYWGGLSGKLRR